MPSAIQYVQPAPVGTVAADVMLRQINRQAPSDAEAKAAKKSARKKPKKKDLLNEVDPNASLWVSTVMITGLPWTYKECDLLKLLDRLLGPGTFDFLYMPWDMKHDTNSGCAFVNFTSCVNAVRCASMLNGQALEVSKSIKPCLVVPAHVQGLVKNLEYYRSRAVGAVKNPHAPMVFKEGVRISFHMAVEKLCPKKPKQCKDPMNTFQAKGTQRPEISLVEGRQSSQSKNFRPPPGLEKFKDSESVDDQDNMPYPKLMPILKTEEKQIPMKVIPSACLLGRDNPRTIHPQLALHPQFSAWLLTPESSLPVSRSQSDSALCSTTASDSGDEYSMDDY
jgi:RNA recognition motif-containing protein